MALTYGFYDSLNHDRVYSANQMSTIFNGIITDGVFMNIGEHFSVVAGTGMQVIVKPGRAWFDGTWTLLDTDYPLSIGSVSTLMGRIDAIVLETNFDVETRANTIKVVAGTPSATPVKPTLTNTDLVKQHILAYVTIPANTTSIANSMIDIQVGVNKETPYITSVLQSTDINLLYLKWEDEWYNWFNDVKATLSGDVAANLKADIDRVSQDLVNVLDLNVWDQTMVVTSQSEDGRFVDDGTVAEYFGITSGSTDVAGHTASELIVHIPVEVYTSSSKRNEPFYVYSNIDELNYPLYNPDGTARASNYDNRVYVGDFIDDNATSMDASGVTNAILAVSNLYHNGDASYTKGVGCLAGFYNGASPRFFYIPDGLYLKDVFVVASNASRYYKYLPYNTSTYEANKHAVIWINNTAKLFVESNLSDYGSYTLCWVARADKLRVGHYESGSVEQRVVAERKTSFDPDAYTEIRSGGSATLMRRTIPASTAVLSIYDNNSSAYHEPVTPCLYVQGGTQVSVVDNGAVVLDITKSYFIIPTRVYINNAIESLRSIGCTYVRFVLPADLPDNISTTSTKLHYTTFELGPDFSVTYSRGGTGVNMYLLTADAVNVYGVGSIDGLTRTKRGTLGDYDNVQWGTYYGTDTCGSDAPCIITFRRRPKIFMMLGFYVVDQDRLTAMPSNADIKPWVALEYCPSEYTMGYGPSMMNATGSFGKYDEENNVYMWYDDTPFGQYNAGPVAFSDDPVLYNAKYYWIAFG